MQTGCVPRRQFWLRNVHAYRRRYSRGNCRSAIAEGRGDTRGPITHHVETIPSVPIFHDDAPKRQCKVAGRVGSGMQLIPRVSPIAPR
jgi:hypothetical protein